MIMEYKITSDGIEVDMSGVITPVSQVLDEDTGYAINSTSNSAAACGFVITAKRNCYLNSITKTSTCTGTRAMVRTNTNTTIATASFSGDIATFSSPILLEKNTSYRILVDNSAGNYARKYNTTPVFPIEKTLIDYVSGLVNTSVSPYAWNITSINVSRSSTSSGCVGIWCKVNDPEYMENLTLKIGNDTNNYLRVDAKSYPIAYDTLEFSSDEFLYYIFKLSNGEIFGNIDWEHIDYIEIIAEVNSSDANVWFDFLTCSKSNQIGCNAIGDRRGMKREFIT